MDDKAKLGVLGSGLARKAGNTIVQEKKRKKSKLDQIMAGIKAGRKAQK